MANFGTGPTHPTMNEYNSQVGAQGALVAKRDPEIHRTIGCIHAAVERSAKATHALRERLMSVSRNVPSGVGDKMSKEDSITPMGHELRSIEDRIMADALEKEAMLQFLEL